MHHVGVKPAFGKEHPQATPQLRPFRISDLEDAYRLDQTCFPPLIAYSRSELGAFVRMRGAQAWVAELADRGETSLAGFVIVCRDRGGQGHVITVDVAAAWRRRAVGTLLMDAAEDWLRQQGGDTVFLETAEDNTSAQAFYLKRGYSKLRRIEDYYADGSPAWLMAKNIGAKPSVEGSKQRAGGAEGRAQ